MSVRVGIIGATGVVGQEILNSMVMLDVQPLSLNLYASEKSDGKNVQTPFGEQTVHATPTSDKIPDLDVLFLAADNGVAKKYGRQLAKRMLVIDNSSHFRYKNDIPLVIPAINGESSRGSNLIANPNCTTAILAMALWPLHQAYGIEKVMATTYQAVSGAGKDAMNELEVQTREYLAGIELSVHSLPTQIAFNLIPRIDSMETNGYTREEMKVAWELRKIMGLGSLAVSCTAVRVPTMRAHAESCIITTTRPVDVERARQLLEQSPGLTLRDNSGSWDLPMPSTATGKSDVEVGRLRNNLVFGENSLEFFVCGDQLLRGAAYNAVEIAKQRLHYKRDDYGYSLT